MKVFLMYRDRDFDLERKLPVHESALRQDLELDTLFHAMAKGDAFLFEIAKKAFLIGLSDPDSVLYRQDILKDCLKNPFIVRSIYETAVDAIESRKKHSWGFYSKYPRSILYSSVDTMQMLVGMLKKLRKCAYEHAQRFGSEGFTRFFAMVNAELTDAYFAEVENHLKELKFRNGVLISAELGSGNKGTNYVLRKLEEKKRSWLERIFRREKNSYTLRIADRDENGFRALSELRDRGVNLVANALAQSAEHILGFFALLRAELAFYLGCLNLHERLMQKGEPVCFPSPAGADNRKHSFEGLYDVCLALNMKERTVGNDLNADDKDLVIITGANQGGKSTFLRGIGLAQMMMQCGMFVPAESFRASICRGLFTHYRREEDISMVSGKLDEELSRMSDIVDNLTADSLILFNESFAATNEREGSEIAAQITSALVEKGVRVFFVTHLYEFARGFYERNMRNAVFLRAERGVSGVRTFKITEGAPLQTSYGEDLYRTVFGEEAQASIGSWAGTSA